MNHAHDSIIIFCHVHALMFSLELLLLVQTHYDL